MVADLQKLSETLDKAAPDKRLADTIRSDRKRIEREIAAKGEARITVDGHTFVVKNSRASEK